VITVHRPILQVTPFRCHEFSAKPSTHEYHFDDSHPLHNAGLMIHHSTLQSVQLFQALKSGYEPTISATQTESMIA
jgi:hypothetical protein